AERECENDERNGGGKESGTHQSLQDTTGRDTPSHDRLSEGGIQALRAALELSIDHGPCPCPRPGYRELRRAQSVEPLRLSRSGIRENSGSRVKPPTSDVAEFVRIPGPG